MAILQVVLQVALVIVSVLLVCVILLQKSKSNGAGVTFGGLGEATFGSEIGNVLTRSTIILGFLFLAMVIALSIITSSNNKGATGSLMDGAATPVAVPLTSAETPAAVPEAAAEAPAPVAAPAAEAPAAVAE